MERKDLLVISALRQDCRQTLSRMSKAIKVPLSTIHDRIRKLGETVIRKHTAIVDFSRIGYNTRAFVLFKVEREARHSLQSHLERCSHVNWLAKVNNGYDFMAEFVFEHIKNMEDYMEELEQKFEFKEKQVFYIIDDIKREEFLANPKIVKIITK